MRVVWVTPPGEAEGGFEVGGGFLQAALLGEQGSQVVVGVDMVRAELECASELVDGFRPVTTPRQRDSQIVVHSGFFGIELNGLTICFDCFV